jgi:hypothetical protein
MSRARLLVRISPDWSRFTYQRPGIELLGTVQRGAQIGALARLPDGKFAQANGDWLHPLNTAQVNLALKQAARGPSNFRGRPSTTSVAAKPVVIVRKKRRILEGVAPVAACR